MSRDVQAEVGMVVRGGGQRALFIVEVGSMAHARRLLDYFAGTPCEIRPIAVGPVVVCAAWTRDGVERPFEKMAEHLRDRYSLSICEPGFGASMYRVALQLARDAEAEVHPLDRCCLCGAAEPFPTVLRLREGSESNTAAFCPACVAATETEDPEALCRVLLRRAGGALAAWSYMPSDEPYREGDAWRLRFHRSGAVPAAC